MAHTVIGTAGHIDHGKTLLVKGLTGESTDRTPQEKARGITIELGFAFLSDEATIIDVPGHERFVKTMVAGVSSIDLALFVIAADDGVMPQSREHLDVLELLGVPRGIIVLNKIDLVDDEWLQLVEEDIAALAEGTFLENAPVMRVSALSEKGIAELKSLLEEMIDKTVEKRRGGAFRMPVDRSFVMKGFGLVCTGTVIAGSLHEGESTEMLPVGRQLRARGLQRHGRAVPEVGAGDRAALNVPGVEQTEAVRGQVIAAPGVFQETHMVDVRLKLLPSCPKSLQQRARVRLHLGTAEVLARVVLLDTDLLEPGREALAQLRLEAPVVAVWGDRFVIRRYSPALTIGGGRILDPYPPKRRPGVAPDAAHTEILESDVITNVIEARLTGRASGTERLKVTTGALGLDTQQMQDAAAELIESSRVVQCAIGNEDCLIHGETWRELTEDIEANLARFHEMNPLKKGISRSELRRQCGLHRAIIFDAVLQRMSADGDVKVDGVLASSTRHQISFSVDAEKLRQQIEEELRAAELGNMPDEAELARRLEVDDSRIRELLRAMQSLGAIVYLDETLFLHHEKIEDIRSHLEDYLQSNTSITVSQFRNLISGNRRFALALLNSFDSDGFTQRQGDVRVLR